MSLGDSIGIGRGRVLGVVVFLVDDVCLFLFEIIGLVTETRVLAGRSRFLVYAMGGMAATYAKLPPS